MIPQYLGLFLGMSLGSLFGTWLTDKNYRSSLTTIIDYALAILMVYIFIK